MIRSSDIAFFTVVGEMFDGSGSAVDIADTDGDREIIRKGASRRVDVSTTL